MIVGRWMFPSAQLASSAPLKLHTPLCQNSWLLSQRTREGGVTASARPWCCPLFLACPKKCQILKFVSVTMFCRTPQDDPDWLCVWNSYYALYINLLVFCGQGCTWGRRLWDKHQKGEKRNYDLAHRNCSDFCDLRLRCPSRTPEIARFPRLRLCDFGALRTTTKWSTTVGSFPEDLWWQPGGGSYTNYHFSVWHCCGLT